jgi:hypothetical protein
MPLFRALLASGALLLALIFSLGDTLAAPLTDSEDGEVSSRAAHEQSRLRQQPDPTKSYIPTCIRLQGTTDGQVDTTEVVSFVIRDEFGTPMPGMTVHLDFSGHPDLGPSAVQAYPGLSVDCETQRVSAITDAAGEARFVVAGSVVQRNPYGTPAVAEIWVDPGEVYFGTIGASAYDQDGRGGLGPSDIHLWLCDFLWMLYFSRSDFDCNGATNILDLVYLLSHYRNLGSAETPPRCDGGPTEMTKVTAPDGEIRLAWSNCWGTGGDSALTISCHTNEGRLPTLVASFIAPTWPLLPSTLGFEAVVDIMAEPGRTLPDWWRFDPEGCRYGSLLVNSAPITPGCAGFHDWGWTGYRVRYPFGTPNVARIEIIGARTGSMVTAPGVEYALFGLDIDRAMTVGPGSCAGCEDSIMVILQSVELFEGAICAIPSDTDTTVRLLRRHSTRSHVLAQGPVAADVPVQGSEGGLTLWILGQNPGPGILRIGFRAAAAAPITFEVIDVSGRVVERRTVNARGHGGQETTFGAHGPLGPGVYMVRASQAGRTATVKAVVLR